MYKEITRKNILRITIKLFKYLVSFIILYFLFNSQEINFKNIYNSNISLSIFILIISLNFIEFLISAIRYTILLLSQNINISIKYITIWTLQGRFLDAILPSSFGGDAIKIYYINNYLKNDKRNEISNKFLFSTVITLADKAFALCGLFLLSSIFYVLLFSTNINIQNYKLYSIISLTTSLIFLFFIIISLNTKFLNSKIFKFIINLRYIGSLFILCINILHKLASNGKKFISIFLLSIANQFISIFSLYIIVFSLNQSSILNIDYNFLISFFFLVPIFFFTNILGIFGGFGIGTLGIGYCLVNLLDIHNGYEIIFLSQSINFLARFLCIFSYIHYNKYIKITK